MEKGKEEGKEGEGSWERGEKEESKDSVKRKGIKDFSVVNRMM